jgi:hypothetical protein
MQIRSIAAVTLAISIAGCGPKPHTDQAVATPASSATHSAETGMVKTKSALSVDPATMADCNGVIATVKWDVRQKHPNVSDVEIYVGPDSAPTLFAAAGSYGEVQTGRRARKSSVS